MAIRSRLLASTVVVLAISGATVSCSGEENLPLPQTSSPTQTTPSSADTSPSESTSDSSDPDDLVKLPVERTTNAGSLTVHIKYTTKLPMADWTARVSKPLRVRLEAVNEKKSRQNLYVTKVTATITSSDASGTVDPPRDLIDASNIIPGYIVTEPNSYNQTFAIPAVDESADYITIDFSYELAQEIARDRDTRDFAKQVATDTLVIPIAHK